MPHQPEVLEVVREWRLTLLARLCQGLHQRCIEQDKPSNQTLPGTRPYRRAGAAFLLRTRMVGEKNSRVCPAGMGRG
eukprot:11211991-Lingulodinium_polyedra.AAC.1